ncbi:MAG: diaminopimelate epimerase [Thermodesulfobacteriota bacterium]
MKFTKYHALGNDYLVINPQELASELTRKAITLLCHRNFGVGSDGLLLGPLKSMRCDFGLKIFNPDGSEAEKSGNGLRIFARWLWDEGRVGTKPFSVETDGGIVSCTVEDDGRNVTVEMGEVIFERINETIAVEDQVMTICTASVGNPHCVVLSELPTAALAQKYGPIIEVDPLFPNRTNVQFIRVIDRNTIQLEIWERGAGYTLASGSSSTAAAAVAYKLGLCDPDITVQMVGGEIEIELNEAFLATMRGPVIKVCNGVIADEMFETLVTIQQHPHCGRSGRLE